MSETPDEAVVALTFWRSRFHDDRGEKWMSWSAWWPVIDGQFDKRAGYDYEEMQLVPLAAYQSVIAERDTVRSNFHIMQNAANDLRKERDAAESTLASLRQQLDGVREVLAKVAARFDRGDGGPNLIPFDELSAELSRRQDIARTALKSEPTK